MALNYAVGVTAAGRPEWTAVDSLLYLQPRPKMFLRAVDTSIAEGHNSIIDAFGQLDASIEWLLMFDADADVHPQTPERLASWGKPAVSALCFARPPTAHPTIFHDIPGKPMRWRPAYEETAAWLERHPGLLEQGNALLPQAPPDSLARVDATGTHCIMVHRQALAAIEPPWFRPLRRDGGRGSDFFFILRLREAGFPVYVDRSVVCGHTAGRITVTALDFLAYWYSQARLERTTSRQEE